MAYAVDIPNPHDPAGEWSCLGYFDTHAEAVAYARETLGADDEGRIGVISEMPPDDDLINEGEGTEDARNDL